MNAKKKTKELQQDMAESAHKIWLAGLGAVAMAEEEGGKLFKNLVEKGEDFENRSKEQVEKAKGAVSGIKVVAESYWETFERTLDDKITSAIHRLGVPTKSEIDRLNKKVDELGTSIAKLRKAESKPAARPRSTVRKTPAKKPETSNT